MPLPLPADFDDGGDHASSTLRSRTKSVSVEIYSVKDPPKKRAKIAGCSKAKAANPEKSEVQRARMATLPSPPLDIPTSILDARQVTDTDESYSENERALSNFLKLHPMLRYARLGLEPCSIIPSLSHVDHNRVCTPLFAVLMLRMRKCSRQLPVCCVNSTFLHKSLK